MVAEVMVFPKIFLLLAVCGAVAVVPIGFVLIVVLVTRRLGPSNNPNLRPCPDCGHFISVRAVTCPQCGAPVKGA